MQKHLESSSFWIPLEAWPGLKQEPREFICVGLDCTFLKKIRCLVSLLTRYQVLLPCNMLLNKEKSPISYCHTISVTADVYKLASEDIFMLKQQRDIFFFFNLLLLSWQCFMHSQFLFPCEVNYSHCPFLCWPFSKQRGTDECFKKWL